jgi:hypothetical protein
MPQALSPIRCPTVDLLPDFQDWLITGKDEENINKAIQVIKEENFKIDQLKTGGAVAILSQKGVPGGTAVFIQSQVSQWKSNWYTRQEAAQGLHTMANRRLAERCKEPYINLYIPDYL